MSVIWLILKVHKNLMKECEMTPETRFRKLNMHYKRTPALWLSYCLEKFDIHVRLNHFMNYKLHIVRVRMYMELKVWYFKYILEVDASDLVGKGGGMCNVHVNIFWTIQIILKTFLFSFFTHSSYLYQIFDSVISNPYFPFYYFDPN